MLQMVVGDLHPKEQDLILLKLTLAESETQPIFPELPQDPIHPVPMCCQILCKHNHTIHVSPDMSSCDLLPQHNIDPILEGRRRILPPKLHNSRFEESTKSQESTAVLVLWPDLHGWEASLCINLRVN